MLFMLQSCSTLYETSCVDPCALLLVQTVLLPGAVRFAMDRAGLVGADGATHCGAFDITYMAQVGRSPYHPSDSSQQTSSTCIIMLQLRRFAVDP